MASKNARGPGKGRGKCDYTMGSNAAKKRRHATAVQVQEQRVKRSPAQQLAVLNNRLGVGVGAARERARLEKLIAPLQ